jgi:hypothetical protein
LKTRACLLLLLLLQQQLLLLPMHRPSDLDCVLRGAAWHQAAGPSAPHLFILAVQQHSFCPETPAGYKPSASSIWGSEAHSESAVGRVRHAAGPGCKNEDFFADAGGVARLASQSSKRFSFDTKT